MTFEIRSATRSDADGITDVQVAAWRAGYSHVFPRSVLYADDFDTTRRTYWNAWRFTPGNRLAVAVRPGSGDESLIEQVIGFSSYGPERERARGFTGRAEIYAFYLLPAVWGSGLAAELMDYTETRIRAEGFESAVLWVLKDNPRGRGFYEKQGWQPTGIGAEFADYTEVTAPEVEYRKEFS